MPQSIQTIARRFGVKSEQYIKALRADQRAAGLEMARDDLNRRPRRP